MIKIGITGGIGSGKSLICDLFARLGISIYKADEKAKCLMNTSHIIRKKLTTKFGNNVYPEGILDRRHLASIIFNDRIALDYVNSIVHPEVAHDFDIWCSYRMNDPYVIEESALLFESNGYKKMDKTITVYAPLEIRIFRAMNRDKATREQILSRIANQMPEDEKIKLSDITIYNNEEQSIIEQVLHLHRTFNSNYTL